jgi:cobalt-zinc-cadmium efflux system outer membrane protein
MKRTFIGSLILMTLVGGTLRGAETNDAPLAVTVTNATTLDTLVAETLARNPEIKFYETEILAAKAGRKTAGLLANPEVSGNVGSKTVRGGGISDEGIAWSVSVVQPFEWPGRLGLRKAIANRDIELAELGYARFKIALAGRVRTLAYGLFATQEKAAAAGEVAGRFKALREVLVQRDPAGLTPLLETRVIEATELNAQRKASEATLATQAALLELNQLRGVALDTRLTVVESEIVFEPLSNLRRRRDNESQTTDRLETPHVVSYNPEMEHLLALARTNNFELRLRAVELAQQGFGVDLAKNERFPSIAVGPVFSEERAGNEREQTIGLGVSLPLPLWNRNTGNIEAAKARQMQAEVSLNVIEREIQRKVIEAALTYETKLQEMAKWRPDSVQHFREAAEVADRHYRLGAVQISTYVELQKQYLEAVESLLDTKKEALDATAQLELLTGLPLPLTSTGPKQEQK